MVMVGKREERDEYVERWVEVHRSTTEMFIPRKRERDDMIGKRRRGCASDML